jgi:hypothetical protein
MILLIEIGLGIAIMFSSAFAGFWWGRWYENKRMKPQITALEKEKRTLKVRSTIAMRDRD